MKRFSKFENLLFWKGKRIKVTDSFREELYDKYRKSLDLVQEILDEGRHVPESREKNYVTKPTKEGFWELVYAEKENYIILIHLKLRRGKP